LKTELTVVIPCLDEADTIEQAVSIALSALREHQIAGEVVVADNGSTDGSQALAERAGARLVDVPVKGYGSALMGGIEAARGRFVLMGDADLSYDFSELPRFVGPLREGADLVQGCRLPSGGGTVAKGAMPPLHRWLGNPVFSMLARWWFRTPIHDIHCGMRAFDRDYVRGLELRCTGMEFASEMIIRATLDRASITEVPITLSPDQRIAHAPHLRTFRDGWRHLRFFLMYSPRWLYLVPGFLLMVLGAAGLAIGWMGLEVGEVRFDVQTMLFGTALAIVGYQAALFGALARVFAMTEGLLPIKPAMRRVFEIINLERGLIVGTAIALIGVVLMSLVVVEWWRSGFGDLDRVVQLRRTIPGVLFLVMGTQTVLASFFFSMLGTARK
jgi:glycosyltransferase involved in cell wall biosynthesis